MKKYLNYLPIFTFSLLVLLTTLFFISLMPFSPKWITADISGASIKQQEGSFVKIPGSRFDCFKTNTLEQVRCAVEVETKLLDMSLFYQNSQRQSLAGCKAFYGDNAIPCRYSFSLVHKTPYIIIDDNLGFSANQLERLWWQNPIQNLSEQHWMWVIQAITIALTINMIVLIGQGCSQISRYWLNTPRWLNQMMLAGPALLSTLFSYYASWMMLLLVTLTLGFVD